MIIHKFRAKHIALIRPHNTHESFILLLQQNHPPCVYDARRCMFDYSSFFPPSSHSIFSHFFLLTLICISVWFSSFIMRTKWENPCVRIAFPFLPFFPTFLHSAANLRTRRKNEIRRNNNTKKNPGLKIFEWNAVSHWFICHIFFSLFSFLSLSLLTLVSCVCLTHKLTYNWIVIFIVFDCCFGSDSGSGHLFDRQSSKGIKLHFQFCLLFSPINTQTHLKAHSINVRESAPPQRSLKNIIIHFSSHRMLRFRELADKKKCLGIVFIRHESFIESLESIETSDGTASPSSETFIRNRTGRRNRWKKFRRTTERPWMIQTQISIVIRIPSWSIQTERDGDIEV